MGLSATDVITNIKSLTAKSSSCQEPANQITVLNVALAVAGSGPIPTVITRLTDIVSTVVSFNQQFAGTGPFTTKTDEESILAAFREFVQVHQNVLHILIGKAGLVATLSPGVGPPIAAVLRQLESVIDALTFQLIEICPDVAAELTKEKNSLDNTIDASIQAWQPSIGL